MASNESYQIDNLVCIHYQLLLELRNGVSSYTHITNKMKMAPPPIREVCQYLGISRLSMSVTEEQLYQAVSEVTQGIYGQQGLDISLSAPDDTSSNVDSYYPSQTLAPSQPQLGLSRMRGPSDPEFYNARAAAAFLGSTATVGGNGGAGMPATRGRGPSDPEHYHRSASSLATRTATRSIGDSCWQDVGAAEFTNIANALLTYRASPLSDVQQLCGAYGVQLHVFSGVLSMLQSVLKCSQIDESVPVDEVISALDSDYKRYIGEFYNNGATSGGAVSGYYGTQLHSMGGQLHSMGGADTTYSSGNLGGRAAMPPPQQMQQMNMMAEISLLRTLNATLIARHANALNVSALPPAAGTYSGSMSQVGSISPGTASAGLRSGASFGSSSNLSAGMHKSPGPQEYGYGGAQLVSPPQDVNMGMRRAPSVGSHLNTIQEAPQQNNSLNSNSFSHAASSMNGNANMSGQQSMSMYPHQNDGLHSAVVAPIAAESSQVVPSGHGVSHGQSHGQVSSQTTKSHLTQLAQHHQGNNAVGMHPAVGQSNPVVIGPPGIAVPSLSGNLSLSDLTGTATAQSSAPVTVPGSHSNQTESEQTAFQELSNALLMSSGEEQGLGAQEHGVLENGSISLIGDNPVGNSNAAGGGLSTALASTNPVGLDHSSANPENRAPLSLSSLLQS